MRMQADAEAQRGPDARKLARALGLDGVVRRENAERLRQSGGLRARDDIGQISHERVVGQMAVGVDHGFCVLAQSANLPMA